MARKRRNYSEEKVGDMTPMIDVTFLLLIFFLVTIKFKTLDAKIQIEMPTSFGSQNTGEVEKPKLAIDLEVVEPGAGRHLPELPDDPRGHLPFPLPRACLRRQQGPPVRRGGATAARYDPAVRRPRAHLPSCQAAQAGCPVVNRVVGRLHSPCREGRAMPVRAATSEVVP